MLSLELAIQKIQTFNPAQRRQVIEFVAFLDFQSREYQENIVSTIDPDENQDFFDFAGIWENKDITTESLRIGAWRTEKR